MTTLQHWASQWGNISSIAGVLLTIVGFSVTIYNVLRSKSVAEETRDSISLYDAIADLAAASSIMDEIKRLQRHGVWAVVPDRYSELRRRLIAIKGSHADLSEAQRQTLEETVQKFADLEKRVERAVSANVAPPNPAKLNDIVSSQIDEVQMVLLSLQQILRQEQ
jgi:hypothetical protein